MPPGTRNALMPPSQNAFGAPPTLAEIQLAQRTYPRPAPLTLSEWLTELQYGLGEGLGQAEAGNLEFYHDVATRPVGVYEDLVAAAKAVAKNPSLVVNNLRAMKQQATSGPYGLGKVVGGFVNPRNFLKPKPQVMEIGGYHGTRPDIAEIIRREGFDMSKQGTAQKFEAQIPGAWFSTSPQIAKKFGKEVIEAELDLKKPYRMKAASYLQKFLYNGEDPKAFAEKLKAKGYDGVHIKFEPEYEGGYGPSGTEEWGFDNYVVFDPDKIKVK